MHTMYEYEIILFFQFPKPILSDKIPEHYSRMTECLDQIENIWLKNKPFLTGNSLTIADIIGSSEIEQPSKYF